LIALTASDFCAIFSARMNEPGQNYTTELFVVTVCHGLLIGALIAVSFIHGCDAPVSDISSPMELIVEAPPSDSSPIPTELAPQPPPENAPEKTPDKQVEEPQEDAHPDPDEVPILKPKEKEKPKKKPDLKPPEPAKQDSKTSKIKVSNKIIKRPLPSGKGKLTAEEVRKLLDRGAKIGKKSSLSEADMRRLLNSDSKFGEGSAVTQEFIVLDMVRQAMYRAWNQPTDIGIAGLVTRVELTFNPDGTIVGSRILSSSGNKVMDASVMRAVESVRRVNNLPSGYLSSHRRIPVAFELTGNN
jgi:colicin import membrane protein